MRTLSKVIATATAVAATVAAAETANAAVYVGAGWPAVAIAVPVQAPLYYPPRVAFTPVYAYGPHWEHRWHEWHGRDGYRYFHGRRDWRDRRC